MSDDGRGTERHARRNGGTADEQSEDDERSGDDDRERSESGTERRADPADGGGDADESASFSPRVLVAATTDTGRRVREWLDDRLSVSVATSRGAAAARADPSVCVALLGASVTQASKESLLETIAVRCPFARTIVVPQDDQPPILEGPGYDLVMYPPLEEEEVREAVTSFARVATYERTVTTYFEYTKLAANREIGRSEADLEADESYQVLQDHIEQLRERLERMQAAMGPAEQDLLFDSLETEETAGFSDEVREAPFRGQPDECSTCGLDWTVDHGGEIGEGYGRLGAFVWKCRKCGAVQQASDPSHQWIA